MSQQVVLIRAHMVCRDESRPLEDLLVEAEVQNGKRFRPVLLSL